MASRTPSRQTTSPQSSTPVTQRATAPSRAADKSSDATAESAPPSVAGGLGVEFSRVPATTEAAQARSIQKKEEEGTPRNETGMPDHLKSGVEALSGIAMDDVRVHYNSSKPAQLDALAYAQGSDIHVAAGQEEHLPHEAWHVVQQKQGRVAPNLNLNGAAINDDANLEGEADAMGERAASHGSAALATAPRAAAAPDIARAPIQPRLNQQKKAKLNKLLAHIDLSDLLSIPQPAVAARPHLTRAEQDMVPEVEGICTQLTPTYMVQDLSQEAAAKARETNWVLFKQLSTLMDGTIEAQDLDYLAGILKAPYAVPAGAQNTQGQRIFQYMSGDALTDEELKAAIKGTAVPATETNISQCLNDIYAGRGKATTIDGVLHASAGKRDAANGCTLFWKASTVDNGLADVVAVGSHRTNTSYDIHAGKENLDNKNVYSLVPAPAQAAAAGE